MKSRRSICTVLVDRANYGRMWPVMGAIQAHPELELITICAGTMLLERFGRAERIVENDGFKIDGRVYFELEGSVPVTMAKSVGLGVVEFVSEFQRLKPDVLLLIGDRYEALAAAVAATYMRIPIAHIQGGEISGSVDEHARHAITKLAQLHFPATERAARFIVRMGELAETVHNVGCPAGDYILELQDDAPLAEINDIGVGASLHCDNPYLLVIYHPNTSIIGSERQQAEELLYALEDLGTQTLWLWPNIDAGSDDISKCLRHYREIHQPDWLHFVKNLEPRLFQRALRSAACAIGNSSSFIRDSSFTGTPVIILGDRQGGREHAENVCFTGVSKEEIKKSVRYQLAHGRYERSTLYGSGTASKQIAQILTDFQPVSQKRLNYIDWQV
jgi:UDP-hydrolysing UDP-N-acetyl-D-glucosamine 2-epimerase